MKHAYPFQFIGLNTVGADAYLQDTLVYAFKSEKSGHHYQVNIERYIEHLCGVKFFDQTTDVRSGKFSQLSGTYEPRTIFGTVADIALDAYQRDPRSSFFFIGAADSRDRSSDTTRRHRVYTAFVNDLHLDNLFRIVEVKDLSMTVLVNRGAVPDIDIFMQRILSFVMG